MSKARKNITPRIGMKDIDPRHMRVHQRSWQVPDKRKARSKDDCRKSALRAGRWS